MISYLDWEEERERNEIADNLNIYRLYFTFEETESQRFGLLLKNLRLKAVWVISTPQRWEAD